MTDPDDLLAHLDKYGQHDHLIAEAAEVLRDARAIVRDLAASDPIADRDDAADEGCVFCTYCRLPSGSVPRDHDETCVWRRARAFAAGSDASTTRRSPFKDYNG